MNLPGRDHGDPGPHYFRHMSGPLIVFSEEGKQLDGKML